MVIVTECGKVHPIKSHTNIDLLKDVDSDEIPGISFRLGNSLPSGREKVWSQFPQLDKGEKIIDLMDTTGSTEDEMLSGGIKKLADTANGLANGVGGQDHREEPENIQGKKSLAEDSRGKSLKEEEGKRMPNDGREKSVNNLEWKSSPHDPGDKSDDSSVLNGWLITGGKRLPQVLSERVVCIMTFFIRGKRLLKVLNERLITGGKRLSQVLNEWFVWIMTFFTVGERLLIGITEWLVRVKTFFTRENSQHYKSSKQFIVLVLLVILSCVHGTSSNCNFKNNYIGLNQQMSNSTLIIDICYDKTECSQENFRWDKNQQQIYLGLIQEWQDMKYSINPIQDSTCFEMKIHNIMPDDLRSLYTFTLKFWPIRVSPEKQPIPVGQPYIVCNESRGLPMLTSRLKHDGSQGLSKTVQVFSEKQGRKEKINNTVSVENGNISVVITNDLSSCYITVKYPYQGHEFILMQTYLTKEDIEMCATKPSTPAAMTEKNEYNVGVVVGPLLGVAFLTVIIAVVIICEETVVLF